MRPLNQDELKKLHALMPRDLSPYLAHLSSKISPQEAVAVKCQCYIVQPVKLSEDVVVIRFAADAPLVNDICSSTDSYAEMRKVLSDDEILVTKIGLIARFWKEVTHEPKKASASHSRRTV